MDYNPHHVKWTDEKVERFWNFQVSYIPFEDSWFTKLVGSGIINFSQKYLPNFANILDYGTGKGYLIRNLLDMKNCVVMGCDFSKDAIEHVNNKFKGINNYSGSILIEKLPSTFQDNFFDVVYLIEAIEHLTDNYLKGTLVEI